MTESSTKRSSKRTAQKKSTAKGTGVDVEVKPSGVDGAMVEVNTAVAPSPTSSPVGLMNKFLASIERAVTEHGEGHDPREVEIALYMALMFASARVAQNLNRLDRVQEDVREFLDVSTVADGNDSTPPSEVGATATAG